MAITTEPGKSDAKSRDTLVVDLGSKSAKQVKKLRKGKGKLMDKVNQCIEELRANNTITGGVQPVVIVVKEKASLGKFLGMMG
jgi:hypothetical protein